MRGPKKSFTCLLPLALYDALRQQAIADEHTMSGDLRQILKRYIEYMDQGGVSWCRGSRNRGIVQFKPSPCQGEGGRAERGRIRVPFE